MLESFDDGDDDTPPVHRHVTDDSLLPKSQMNAPGNGIVQGRDADTACLLGSPALPRPSNG